MKQILAIARKELEGFFGSPLALIFLGAFLAVELFIFFSVETFFARGVADVRPLFRWMPILLIFLLAALAMRQWSEEQRSGTLEILLTLPVDLTRLVLGKFLGVMAMIGLALALTLPLPLMVSLLGSLDWGPVLGGYLAAVLMAAAYAAIGLFISSRTDNQIVALIATVLLGGLFYLIGARAVTDFLGGPLAEAMWALGTGSRFESIERGVIDLRDLVYYLSLAGIFLTLNVLSLDSLRWSQQQTAYRRKLLLSAGLLVLNLALVNAWLYPLQGLRLDLTAQRQYSLSPVTRDLLGSLQEPLLIRGYISQKTHPLLSPLIPQIRDMLREYEIASGGRITAEVIDPLSDPEIEAEASQTYGIRATPFQISGRYEASVINSYFDILVRYGDQSSVLSFRDLIEVTPTASGVDVRLRNLEYDLTRTIKRVVFGFQSVDAVLAELSEPARLTLYATQNSLPETLLETQQIIYNVGIDIQNRGNGKFVFEAVDPDQPGSPLDRQALFDRYSVQSIPVSLFSADSFVFSLVLQNGEQSELIYPASDWTDGEVRTAIEAALKRTASGFLKVVGIWSPPETPTQDMFGQVQQATSTYQLIRQQLGQTYTVRDVDLAGGRVENDIDVLVVIAPQGFSSLEQFAIDQYLMRGGSVIITASTIKVAPDSFTGLLTTQPIDSGLTALLESYGLRLGSGLVMDPQNMPFPIVVTRDVSGFQVQEIQAINYPFFVEVLPDGMDTTNPILGNLAALTLSWTAPVEVDAARNEGRQVSTLATSTGRAWLRLNQDIQPNFDLYPDLGFPVEGAQQAYPLAVAVQGSFESYFKGQVSPLLGQPGAAEGGQGLVGPQPESAGGAGQAPVINQSPDTARLVLVGSSAFLDDFVLQLSSRLSQDRYLNNLLFLQNAVDWSVEDLDLLTIRSRGTFTRVLKPLEARQETIWEGLNYAAALAALLGIYFGWRARKANEAPLDLIPPRSGSAHPSGGSS